MLIRFQKLIDARVGTAPVRSQRAHCCRATVVQQKASNLCSGSAGDDRPPPRAFRLQHSFSRNRARKEAEARLTIRLFPSRPDLEVVVSSAQLAQLAGLAGVSQSTVMRFTSSSVSRLSRIRTPACQGLVLGRSTTDSAVSDRDGLGTVTDKIFETR
jgi:hypothetical protein